MKDKEFSGGGREFSLPGQEFSNPGREWASQPEEMNRSGREYRQESAPAKPEQKRRRRVFRPAALTAATLVTASIVLGSFSLSPPRAQYPVQQLSAEHRAYLDTVWENMEQADRDELKELAQDPTLEDIVVNVVDPFLERVREEYGSVDGQTTIINDGYNMITFRWNDRSAVHYNGEALVISDEDPNYLCVHYDDYSESEHWNTVAEFDLYDGRSPASSDGSVSENRTYTLSLDRDPGDSYSIGQTWRSWALTSNWNGATWTSEPFGEWSYISTREYDWPETRTGLTFTEDRMEGEFFGVTDFLDAAGRFHKTACLYNGRVTSSYWEENGVSVSGTIYVENGYTTGWDGAIYMEEDNRPVYTPQLKVTDYFSKSVNFTRHFITPDSNDLLFAQFTANLSYQSDIPVISRAKPTSRNTISPFTVR